MNKKLILASSLMLILSACGGKKEPEQTIYPDEGVVVPDLAIGENVISPDDYGTDYLKASAISFATEMELTSDFNVSVLDKSRAPAAMIFKTASFTRTG